MNKLLAIALVLSASMSSSPVLALATNSSERPAYSVNGQQEAAPALAARMALPDCGFAATESWGANGYQLCDGRNVHQSIPTARPLRRW